MDQPKPPIKALEKLTGKRRVVPVLPGLRFPIVWPMDAEKRLADYRDWHRIAMQILHNEKASFRLIAAISAALDWNDGTVCLTDDELAEVAGKCGSKSISRDIATYKTLGLLVTEYGWRERNGKNVRMRILRTAVPEIFPDYVKI